MVVIRRDGGGTDLVLKVVLPASEVLVNWSSRFTLT